MQLFEEVDRIHKIETIQRRFREGFEQIVPKVLALTKGKSSLEKFYMEARQEALSENLPGT